MTFLKSATVSGSRVLKIWSRSTAEIVCERSRVPPSGIGSTPSSSAGSVSWTWRLATPESEKDRTCATVPEGSGVYCSSTEKRTSALPLSASSMLLTVPARVPPIVTSLPLTSWEALVNSAVTS